MSFMQPLARDRAVAFWQRVALDVSAEKRALLVAEDALGICGTVQLILDLPENQPHRADLAKMLVHRRARRCGLGEALMKAAESAALASGKWLRVLDCVTGGDSERLLSPPRLDSPGRDPGLCASPRRRALERDVLLPPARVS